jgi:hypothetical protein
MSDERRQLSIDCPHCGDSIPLSWDLCPRCGGNIRARAGEVYLKHARETGIALLVALFGGLLVGAVCFGVWGLSGLGFGFWATAIPIWMLTTWRFSSPP